MLKPNNNNDSIVTTAPTTPLIQQLRANNAVELYVEVKTTVDRRRTTRLPLTPAEVIYSHQPDVRQRFAVARVLLTREGGDDVALVRMVASFAAALSNGQMRLMALDNVLSDE